MESPAGTAARYHVLLVGIDDYSKRPLDGCVNDIDAVQRLLLAPRLGLVKERIRRLASPRPGRRRPPLASHAGRPDETIDEQPATLGNLRAALAALGSEQVSPGDRVFIYYSGHGMRVPVHDSRGRRYFREALVPADFASQGDLDLLYDYEVNQLLRAIVARTPAVTLVLDCCHASSVSRGPNTRSIPLTELAALVRGEVVRDPVDGAGAPDVVRALADGIEDCQVVAACLGHQQAIEAVGPGNVPHGLLTSALLAALGEPDIDLSTVTWARIWQTVRTEVQHRNPSQDPVMFGSAGRAVLGGPPVDGDAGFIVTPRGSRARVEAGTLADVTRDAVLAVYGPEPARFPPLDSPEDHRARAGLLRVVHATRSTATADAVKPFALPPGARARLVQAGAADRLRCASVPPHRELAEAIAGSPLLELVEPGAAQVQLVWKPSPTAAPSPSRSALPDGRWLLTDDRHRVDPEAPALYELQPWELARARPLLEHYHAYARVLRVAARARDLTGELELSVQRCTEIAVRADLAQSADLTSAPSRDGHAYTLHGGDRVCFRVRNGSRHALRVTLINAAASGKVLRLGEEVLDPGSFHQFWAGGALGMPFEMQLPRGVRRCLDRLVAIGTTAMERDLGYLQVEGTFAEAVAVMKSHGKDLGVPAAPAPLERWTSAQVIIETSAP